MTLAILTCSPNFVPLALHELSSRVQHITPLNQLVPGFILLHSSEPYRRLTAPWRQKLPIYLHHMMPVHRDGSISHLNQTIKAISPRECVIQTRILSPELSYEISNSEPLPTSLKAPDTSRILSIVIFSQSEQTYFCAGVSHASENISPWAGGIQPIEHDVPNRAGYKLWEAIKTFKPNLHKMRHALDLGAGPGAWTIVLREHNLQVTAVSPKVLYRSLREDRFITHHAMTAEAYLNQVQQTFDLITNDMIMDAQDSARIMVAYARFLNPGGRAIMTLKLRMRNQQRVIDHSLRLLRKAYRIIYVRQLVSNKKEVTLYMKKK